jgi:DNA adenine methylase
MLQTPRKNSNRRSIPSPIIRPTARRKLIAFGWYGGKFSHLGWLLPFLPACHHYCEPFAGSAAVLLNRFPSPVETYNDLDGEVVNFFRTLRNQKDRLVEVIGLTPFSREEFALACTLDPKLEPLERARRFYVRARQVRTGLAQKASVGRWANCKNTSRAGMSGVISRWLGATEALPEIIQLYDSSSTLFYCDPPYIHDTRGDSSAYGNEMTDNHHRELATVLNSAKGMAAISSYDCPLMDELYKPPKWRKVVGQKRNIHSTKGMRVECLWTNYDPVKADQKRMQATLHFA